MSRQGRSVVHRVNRLEDKYAWQSDRIDDLETLIKVLGDTVDAAATAEAIVARATGKPRQDRPQPGDDLATDPNESVANVVELGAWLRSRYPNGRPRGGGTA